ncbi:MAG TPA: hypothetical protein VEA17_17250 [Bordetella sp.]|nr:hypothetical protein [Bordetella sp.]
MPPTELEEFKDDLAAPNGASLVGFIQSETGAATRTVQDKAREIVSPADFAGSFDPEAANPFEGSISYGGWQTSMPRHGLFVRTSDEYGSIKATPSNAEPLPGYYFRIPYFQTHPGDIYPAMGLGYKQDWPKGMRSTHVGYWTGAGAVQVSSSLEPVAALTPLARHYGLTYEPLGWSTLVGERAGRLCKDYAPTMMGQQAGLSSVGYSSNFFGRQAGQFSYGMYNSAYGNNAADHLFGERNLCFGHEAGLQARASYCVFLGQRSGANSALTNSVAAGYLSMQTGTDSANTALGYRAAQQIRGDNNTAIGNSASVSVAETTWTFIIDASGIDIPENRLKMPDGTAAVIGLASGDYIRLDWDGSTMTRPPKAYSDALSGVFAFIPDGVDEWIYASTVDVASGYEIQTSDKLYWYESNQNDSRPASNKAPVAWQATAQYTVRDTVTTPNAPGQVFLWIKNQDQSPSTAPEPTVGPGWEAYWVRTEPGTGSISFTPYRKVNSATAVGSLSSARFDNSIALGRGATTTRENQCVVGNSQLEELRIPSLAAFKCGTTLMMLGQIGTPEGVVTAPKGSIYTRVDGTAGTTLYVKESGSGNTGWVAK